MCQKIVLWLHYCSSWNLDMYGSSTLIFLYSCICRQQREEARITAWENLQKAKAEAAIQKLEVSRNFWCIIVYLQIPTCLWIVQNWLNFFYFGSQMKLAKRRSASMDKIMNKLRLSQLKAQTMRRAITEGRRRTSKKLFPFQKYFKIGSFSSCFYCSVH